MNFIVPLLPGLLQALGALAVAGITYLTYVVQQKTKADTAWRKLGEIGVGLLGDAWVAIGPKVQIALADGKIDAAERAAITDAVNQMIEKSTSKETLEGIAKAAGVPFAAIVARLVSDFIHTWTAAHDPSNVEVSALAFPVAGGNYVGRSADEIAREVSGG